MEKEEAMRLAQFIKDHDKRFEASAKTDELDSNYVLLTRVSDGTTLEPITRMDQYQHRLIEDDDPGPTVRAAWENWGRGA